MPRSHQFHEVFSEFLLANGEGRLLDYLNSVETFSPIPDAFFNPLCEKLKMYFVTGGMPESVRMWTQEQDIEAMQTVLSNIVGAYERDFAKHPDVKEFPKISLVWRAIPSQLAKENKKFLYKVVKEGARAREYEDALQWLVDAQLVSKIYRSSAPGLPISGYDDLMAFKLYLVDVGLLRRLALLAPSAFSEGNRLFTEFRGALSENYVLQALQVQFEATPRYWSVLNPSYEVDFLIQRENDVFPVEVKSGDNLESVSLRKFRERFADRMRARFWGAGLDPPITFYQTFSSRWRPAFRASRQPSWLHRLGASRSSPSTPSTTRSPGSPNRPGSRNCAGQAVLRPRRLLRGRRCGHLVPPGVGVISISAVDR